MDAAQIRERLHLRIEQADDEILTVLAEMAESLFKVYQPQAETQSYEQHLRPLTRAELTSEIETSMADYERGDYLALEESGREAASW